MQTSTNRNCWWAKKMGKVEVVKIVDMESERNGLGKQTNNQWDSHKNELVTASGRCNVCRISDRI